MGALGYPIILFILSATLAPRERVRVRVSLLAV